MFCFLAQLVEYTAANNSVLGKFPGLKVEQRDVPVNLKKIEEEFLIAAKLKSMELGVHEVIKSYKLSSRTYQVEPVVQLAVP